MPTKSNSSKRIKIAMEKLNMTQTDLWEKTQIPRGTLSQYISGSYEPSQHRLTQLAAALNCTEAWLMGFGQDWDTSFGNNEIDSIKKTIDLVLTQDERELIEGYRALVEPYKKFCMEFMQHMLAMARQHEAFAAAGKNNR